MFILQLKDNLVRHILLIFSESTEKWRQHTMAAATIDYLTKACDCQNKIRNGNLMEHRSGGQ